MHTLEYPAEAQSAHVSGAHSDSWLCHLRWFDLYKTTLPVGANNHLALDLLRFTRGPSYRTHDGEQRSNQAALLKSEQGPALAATTLVEEALVNKGRRHSTEGPEITCQNCLRNRKAATSWDKNCKRFIPGKTKFEMKVTVPTDGDKKQDLKTSKALLQETSPVLSHLGQGKRLKHSPNVRVSRLLNHQDSFLATSLMVTKTGRKLVSRFPSLSLRRRDYRLAELPAEQDGQNTYCKTPVKLPMALRRIHDKLRDPAELYKLHLKHHHMSLSQFKKRTSALQTPKDIYEAYGELVKTYDVGTFGTPIVISLLIKGR